MAGFSINNNSLKGIIGAMLILGVGGFLGYRIVSVPKREEVVFFLLAFSLLPLLKYWSFGLYLLFIITPFIPFVRRVYYLAYARPGTDILILLPEVILVLTVGGYLFSTTDRKEENPYVHKVKRVLIGYVIYLAARVVILNELSIADAFLKFKYYGPFVFCFFLGAASAEHPNRLKGLGGITLLLGVISALYGIKQLYWGFSAGEYLWLQNVQFNSLFIGGIARPFSFFVAPAAFADFMQIAILTACTFWIFHHGILSKILPLVFIPLFGYAMLITSVRSSWVGAIAGFLLWATVLRKPGKQSRIIGLVAVILFFAVGSFFMDYFNSKPVAVSKAIANSTDEKQVMDLLVRQRLSAVTNPMEEHSMTSRITIWTMVWNDAFSLMGGAFGWGIGTYSADSLYFTYLAELGFPGLILLLYILWLLIKGGFDVFDRLQTAPYRALAKGILAMNMVLLIINITGNHIQSYPGDLYFWFWNGVLLKLGDAENAENPVEEESFA